MIHLISTTYPALDLPNPHLTRPRSWSRRRVTRGHRVVNVDHDSRIRRLVRTGERYKPGRRTIATTGNLNLGARNVELSSARGPGRVQRDVLNAEEVLARGKGLGNGDGDLRRAWNTY